MKIEKIEKIEKTKYYLTGVNMLIKVVDKRRVFFYRNNNTWGPCYIETDDYMLKMLTRHPLSEKEAFIRMI